MVVIMRIHLHGDTSIEADGKIYKSPFNSCSDKAYVILITDGEPTLDKAADNKIKALGNADNYPMSSYNGNYLAALAGWMNNNDVNKEVDGKANGNHLYHAVLVRAQKRQNLY